MRWSLPFTFALLPFLGHAQWTYSGDTTPTWEQVIARYQELDARHGGAKLLTIGADDGGQPIHLFVVSDGSGFTPDSIRAAGKNILWVTNGIHPGEPDGVDASLMLAQALLDSDQLMGLVAHSAVCIVPMYNVSGAKRRGSFSRANQNGPSAYGFRGNARNLDLNRDFIKSDSKEARSFAEIFHLTDPDIFLDNHVSNGADYQHVMTLLTSQHSKLGGIMGDYLHKQMEPGIYSKMKDKGYDLVPYVSFGGNTPDAGMTAYFDGPRYSSGYATLWHTFAFVAETHMLKPYDQRVKATYALMETMISFATENTAMIKELRDKTKASVITQTDFPVSWTIDRTKSDLITFKGYEAGRKPSDISGLPRLYYDRSKPYEKKIPYFNYFSNKTVITKPDAYIIPQGWWTVIDLLKINKIAYRQFAKDTSIEVEVYKIEDYKAAARQYEMHHPNSDVKTSTSMQKIKFRKGDYYIPMNQPGNRFLMEVLEPSADDSYFAWNFFDAILGQKEGYSGYAYEDIAAQYLKEHPELKVKLDERKKSDSAFAKNGGAQLNFVYQNSPYYEPNHNRYPVYRVKNK